MRYGSAKAELSPATETSRSGGLVDDCDRAGSLVIDERAAEGGSMKDDVCVGTTGSGSSGMSESAAEVSMVI
jgi:hypothetical protein